MCIPGDTTFIAGNIIMFISIVAYACHYIMRSNIYETKENNTRFLMSLPISSSDYVRVRFYSAIINYLLLWVGQLAVLTIAFGVNQYIPSVVFTHLITAYGVLLSSFVILLTLSLYIKSEKWTIFGVVCINSFLMIYFNIVPQTSEMKEKLSLGNIWESGFIWMNISIETWWGILIAIASSTIAILFLSKRTKEFI